MASIDLRPAKAALLLDPTTDVTVTFTVVDSAGAAEDLTGNTFTLDLYDSAGNLDSTATMDHTNVATGIVTASFDDDTLGALSDIRAWRLRNTTTDANWLVGPCNLTTEGSGSSGSASFTVNHDSTTVTITTTGGNAANGLPSGGAAGDVLVKSSATSYDVEWSNRVINVKDYGATGDGTTNDTTALQAAIDAATAGAAGVDSPSVVYVPAGNYKHDGLTITDDADFRARIHIKGGGRGISTLQCRADDDIGLSITNTAVSSANTREVVVSDLTFASGANAIYIDDGSYNVFINCTFSFTKSYAVEISSGASNEFIGCWWVENQGDGLRVNTGDCQITGGIFGESAGQIYAQSHLTMNGVKCFSSASNLDSPGGPVGMGRGLFYVAGHLHLSGCYLSSNYNMFNLNYAEIVTATGCTLAANQEIIALENAGTNGTTVVLVGNEIDIEDGASFYERTGTGHLTNSVITDNVLYQDGPSYTATFEEALLDPQYGNIVRGNTLRT